MIRGLRQVWKSYGKCSLSDKLRIFGRYSACPFQKLARWFPEEGDILDVGCGHGLLSLFLETNKEARKRRYVGIDHDQGKIELAQRANIDGAEFISQDISDVEVQSYDCVSLIDVLYSVPLADWPSFLKNCVNILRKDGLLVIKEPASTSLWKTSLIFIEEILAIKVFRITKGAKPHFESLETYRSQIEAAGADVIQVKILDPWRPHVHCLMLAKKR